jgi:hypothetical protein
VNDKLRDLLLLVAIALALVGAYQVHSSLAFLLGGGLLFWFVLRLWPRGKGDDASK